MKRIWILFLFTTLFLFIVDLLFRTETVTSKDAITGLLFSQDYPSLHNVMIQFRLPRCLTALFAGAALAVSGLYMQTLFQNPLAGPSLLGVSSGASLGVSISVLLLPIITRGVPGIISSSLLNAGYTLSAITGSAFILLLILVLIHSGKFTTFTLLIFGLLLGYIASAAVSILLQNSAAHQIKGYLNWTFGSFSSAGWRELMIMGPILISGLILSQLFARKLNLLLLGDTYARSMGLSPKRFYRSGIILTAALTGTVTAFCGPIGFIGIAVPHLCRLLIQDEDHRKLLPAVLFCGASVTLLADTIAHLYFLPFSLPLNAVTVLISAPVIIYVLLRNSRRTL